MPSVLRAAQAGSAWGAQRRKKIGEGGIDRIAPRGGERGTGLGGSKWPEHSPEAGSAGALGDSGRMSRPARRLQEGRLPGKSGWSGWADEQGEDL